MKNGTVVQILNRKVVKTGITFKTVLLKENGRSLEL